MKEIILKRITLLNFKGARELSIDFNQSLTNIFGRNGSGKTTVFDAFTWLLFGKDSQDRKKFDLKTIDNAGIIIPQIPHEVSAVITVNGEEIRLTRRFTEKWVKRAGQTDPVFTGNEEERFYNDVPCSAREYDAKIAEICNETVFKFITSPVCFCAQSAEAQKQMLFKMAGSIPDTEIASGNADFEALLGLLTGKTLEEFKKEISAKKTRLNAEISGIPGRIDEKKRDIAEEDDWDALTSDIAAKRKARAEIEKQLDEAAEAQRVADRQKLEYISELGKLRQSRSERINAIKEDATKDYFEKKRKRDSIINEILREKNIISMNERSINIAQHEIEVCAATREKMIAEYKQLHISRSEIQRAQITFNEDEFVCPTCKRPLDVADIEAKQAEMTENFEKKRSERLQRVANDIEENQRLGKANNDKKARYEAEIEKCNKFIEDAKTRISELEKSAEYCETLTEPDITPLLASDSEIQQLDKLIQQLEEKTSEDAPKTSNTDLKTQRATLTSEIEALSARLGKRDNNQRAKSRIAELEKQYQSLNEEIAELEKLEFTMTAFSKARSEAIERRIDGLFSLVKFRWIAPAINGAEKETCEATLDGKPYATCSAGEKILIGLDIINAISTSQGIFAPIFIDNAESLTRELPMKSQIINLRVSPADKLEISTNI